MNATKTDRSEFPIYLVEQDNGDGRLVNRLSFVQSPTIERIHEGNTGLVSADIMDGGQKGTITAPAGSTLYETVQGETMLSVGTYTFSAKEAYECARVSDRSYSFGLGFKPLD